LPDIFNADQLRILVLLQHSSIYIGQMTRKFEAAVRLPTAAKRPRAPCLFGGEAFADSPSAARRRKVIG